MVRELLRSATGYPGLFVSCAVSGLLVPLPEDFSLLYAGVRIAASEWAWAPTIAVALLGVLVRDVFAFGLGRTFDTLVLGQGRVSRMIGNAKIERARSLVTTHGPAAVLGGRFLVGFRAPVFVVAGALGVPLREFVLWDLLGLLVMVPTTIGLGFVFGDPLAELVFWLLQRARLVAVVAGLVAVAWLLITRRSGSDPSRGVR